MVLFCNLLFNLILLTATHDTTYRFIPFPLFKKLFYSPVLVDIWIYFYFKKILQVALEQGLETMDYIQPIACLVNRILLEHSHPFVYLSSIAATSTTVIVLICCGKDQGTLKTKNIYYLTLYRVFWPCLKRVQESEKESMLLEISFQIAFQILFVS